VKRKLEVAGKPALMLGGTTCDDRPILLIGVRNCPWLRGFASIWERAYERAGILAMDLSILR
jgi:hypothetical protein